MKKLILMGAVLALVALSGCVYRPYPYYDRYGYYGDRYYGGAYRNDGYYGRDYRYRDRDYRYDRGYYDRDDYR